MGYNSSNLQDAIMEFFTSGRLSRQWNHTLLALVLKVAHAPVVMDYQPICCCTVVYKVIFKVLATWMAAIIDSLLNPTQVAFVQGRSIAEHIHLTQKLLQKYVIKRISPRCVLKVDFQKALTLLIEAS